MKKIVVLSLLTGLVNYLPAQENDDLYFRAKDRQKVVSSDQIFVSNFDNFKRQHFPEAVEEKVNPTDSYSARQLNPEYAARTVSGVAAADEENYFVQNYRPSAGSVPYNNSYYFNNPWNNPWGMGWYSSAWARPWNNPWYWGYYDPWMNPWMNTWSPGFGWGWSPGWNYGFNSMWAPGYGGWSVSAGYSWGNSWAWNSGWCSPFWNSWSMWNRPVYWGWSSEVRNVNYSKRYSQTNAVAGDVRRYYNTTPRPSNSGTNINNGSPSGRIRSDEYYVPPARRSAPVRQNSSYGSESQPQQRIPVRSWDNTDSNFNRNSGGMNNSRPSYSMPSRSSGSFSPGGARPSAPSGGGRRGGGQ